jgi:hypothetical protein
MVVSVSLLASGESKFDPGSTAGFLTGKYVLVGRKPDSEATYTGRVILKQRGNEFDVVRIIGKQTVNGTASFDTVTPDKIPVLRMRFQFDGQPFDATYLWRGDLSNYARLTGYVYSPDNNKTKFPGLEALFALDAIKSP